MKHYKDAEETALIALAQCDQVIKQLTDRIKELENQTFAIRMISSIEL